MIKKLLLFTLTLMQCQVLQAAIRIEIKRPDGSTNWQHVANVSASILILLLTIAVITLFFTRSKARKANNELNTIRSELELRVDERTATLNESNKLLEQEIAEHVSTSGRLRSSDSYITDILKSMPLILIGLDKDGCITQWNKRAEETTGIQTEKSLGKNLWDIYPTITLSSEQIDEAIVTGETITIKHSQRGQYYYDITIYPLQAQSEPGVVVLIDDITKKILAENMLIQNDKMSSVGELAATMAQDINTPLQSILFDLRTFQHLLMDSTTNLNEISDSKTVETLKGLLEDAHDKGESMAAIAHNLQDFARGRNNEKQHANIVDIMEHTLELAADVISIPSRLKFKDIHIERTYQSDLPSIPCYVAELQHVFLSLFRHTCDALSRVEKADYQPAINIQMNISYDSFWIRIQHNGVGLTSEEQMYLFEPVFREDSAVGAYDANQRLSFTHFIITEQHQGQLAVTSDVELGTTFHIQLQLK